MPLYCAPIPRSGRRHFWLVEGMPWCFNGGMSKKLPKQVEPVVLPQRGEWQRLGDIGSFVGECMKACGLTGWRFEWDRAVRRLGCCKPTRRVVSLSVYFARTYLEKDRGVIWRTIMHELAHAMAWVRCRELGHGAAWRMWCAALGIADEKAACACDDFAPPERKPRYALCHVETGEVYRYYMRMPRLSQQKLQSCYIPGKKEETLGKLCVMELVYKDSL